MRVRVLLGVVALAAGVLLAAGGPAAASPGAAGDGDVSVQSAFGSTPVSSFAYQWEGVTINVPTGCLLSHSIQGSGRQIDKENSGVDCEGPGWWSGGFCNWALDYKFYDANDHGKLYKWLPDKVHGECSHDLVRYKNNAWTAKDGPACVVLMVNGAERARQCHSIHG